jgi:hypothetical protein
LTLLEANYQAVRLTGAQGQRLKVDLAQATSDSLSAETLGLVTETIANNQEGFVTTSGLVRGIDTTGTLQGESWADGDVLYLSPTTAGRITNIKPVAPNHLVIIGYVVYSHNTQGTIFVKVDSGYELDELHNVLINTGSLTSGQLLVRSGSVWINSTQLTGSYALTGSLTVTQNISASSFTGSLLGTATTASYVVTALTASYVTASNIVGTVTSASYAVTASRVIGATPTEIGYLSGVTSNIQTQLDNKFTTPTGWTDYFASSTINGGTGTTGVINYIVMGKILFVQINISMTSNANSFNFTLPYTNGTVPQFGFGRGLNLTTTHITVGMYMAASTNVITLLMNTANITTPNVWGTSGTKSCQGFLMFNIP